MTEIILFPLSFLQFYSKQVTKSKLTGFSWPVCHRNPYRSVTSLAPTPLLHLWPLYLLSFLCKATLLTSLSGVCWSSWGAPRKPRNKRTSPGRACLHSAPKQRERGSSRARWWAASRGKPQPERLSACRRAGMTPPSCSSASSQCVCRGRPPGPARWGAWWWRELA